MTSITVPTQPRLDAHAQDVLAELRARIRRYIWLEGLAAAATWLGMAFWASLAIDWFFEPPAAVRGAILTVAVLVLLGVVAHLILRRILVPLSDSNLATVLERRFAQLGDSLLTAVSLTGRALEPDECDPLMLARTCREASQRIRDVELQKVFNPAPLRRCMGGAVLLVVSIAAYAGLCSGALGTWARRNLAFSDELWPRRTHLLIDGFQNGTVKVARGADVTILARADTSYPNVPQVVEIHYRPEGGSRHRVAMSREGTADPATEAYQEYNYTFQAVLAPIDFEVVGGDDRVRDLRIEAVDSPTISAMLLECTYPAYIRRAPRTLPVTGLMQIPFGTRVALRATANKELRQVRIETAAGGSPGQPQVVPPQQVSADRRSFTYVLESLRENTTLLFWLADADGIETREPVRLSLVAVPDEPPQLSLRLDGIGTAITPAARLPLVGQITDDYGIDKAWAEASVDKTDRPRQALAAPPGHPTTYALSEAAIEAGELKLRPGQKLLLSVKASDLYDLGSGPHIGTSERWLLDVVTAEQLRAMLEARELVLRQRFETIVQEVTDSRDLLARLEFDGEHSDNAGTKPSANDKDQAASKEQDNAKEKSAIKGTVRTAVAATPGNSLGAEPGDTAEAIDFSRQRAAHVERALANAQKNTQEILGVAESFDDIRKQLINNRIDTEELKQRLEAGIARPLQQIATVMFPEFERRLERLQASLDDQQLGPAQRVRAVQQAADILVAMQAVLDRMLELESFNEAVEMLRTIIQLQGNLQEQTKQRHNQAIRDLKED